MSLTRVPRRMLDANVVDQEGLQDVIDALTTNDIEEGASHLYFTQERVKTTINVSGGMLTYNVLTGIVGLSSGDFTTAARASLIVTGDLEYNALTGVLSYTGPSPDNIQDSVGALLTNGIHDHIIVAYDDANNRINLSLVFPFSDEIIEGETNLYFTTARARSALSSGAGISFDQTSGVISTTPFFGSVVVPDNDPVIADTPESILKFVEGDGVTITTIPLQNTVVIGMAVDGIQDTISMLLTTGIHDHIIVDYDDDNNRVNLTSVLPGTDEVVEGLTNLYFTNERARTSLSAGAGIVFNNVSGEISTDPFFRYIEVAGSDPVTADAAGSSFNFVEGTNVSITTIPSQNSIVISSLFPITDQVNEGTTNLYFTTPRARASLQAGTGINYNSTSGVISSIFPNTDQVVEGTTNLYFTTARARVALQSGVVAGAGILVDTIADTLSISAIPHFANIEVPDNVTVTADTVGSFFKIIPGSGIHVNTVPSQNAIVISATGIEGPGEGGAGDPLAMLFSAMVYG